MTPQELKSSILQLAVQGKLVEQRPEEGTGEELYQQIQEEKQCLIETGKIKKTKALPQILEDEISAEFPKSWKICYIDDIAFVTKLAGFEYTKNVAPNLSETGIPLFKGKNVQNGKLVLNFESFIPETVSDELPRSQILKKCLLTPYVGTIGNIAIFDGSFKAHLGSNVGKIDLLNGEQKYLMEEYVMYYLRSTIGYRELTKYKKATAQESISIDAIRNVIIAIPPLAEQKRIVAKIEELLPYIDRYEQAWSKLEDFNKRFPEDMQKSILQMAIQGKLVEQRPEEGSGEELYPQIQFEKQRLIKDGKIKKEKPLPEIAEEEKPFDIPESWKWVYLCDVAGINGGFAFKSTDYTTEGVRVIRISDFNESGFINDKIVRYCFDETLIPYVLEAKNILLCMTGGTVGKSLFVDSIEEKMVVNQRVATIKVQTALPEYIYKVILAPFTQSVIQHSKNSTNDNISMDTIKRFLIPLPPLDEQRRIVARLEELLPLCKKLK